MFMSCCRVRNDVLVTIFTEVSMAKDTMEPVDIVYYDRESGDTIERVTADLVIPHKSDSVILHGDAYLVRGRTIDYDEAVIEVRVDRLES